MRKGPHVRDVAHARDVLAGVVLPEDALSALRPPLPRIGRSSAEYGEVLDLLLERAEGC